LKWDNINKKEALEDIIDLMDTSFCQVWAPYPLQYQVDITAGKPLLLYGIYETLC
jgi:hypothetical protein